MGKVPPQKDAWVQLDNTHRVYAVPDQHEPLELRCVRKTKYGKGAPSGATPYIHVCMHACLKGALSDATPTKKNKIHHHRIQPGKWKTHCNPLSRPCTNRHPFRVGTFVMVIDADRSVISTGPWNSHLIACCCRQCRFYHPHRPSIHP